MANTIESGQFFITFISINAIKTFRLNNESKEKRKNFDRVSAVNRVYDTDVFQLLDMRAAWSSVFPLNIVNFLVTTISITQTPFVKSEAYLV